MKVKFGTPFGNTPPFYFYLGGEVGRFFFKGRGGSGFFIPGGGGGGGGGGSSVEGGSFPCAPLPWINPCRLHAAPACRLNSYSLGHGQPLKLVLASGHAAYIKYHPSLRIPRGCYKFMVKKNNNNSCSCMA